MPNSNSDTPNNPILEKSFQFAIDIIEFSEQLEEMRKFIIARQILKSGTSIGAQVREAQGAESKADFVHKMKIAAKEAEETEYWLLLCKCARNYPTREDLLENVSVINKLLSKIIASSKRNLK
jgi:four helix bundle protein